MDRNAFAISLTRSISNAKKLGMDAIITFGGFGKAVCFEGRTHPGGGYCGCSRADEDD